MSSPSGAHRMTPPAVSTAEMAMLAISQKPERVSNILRSSTWITRVSGTRATTAAGVRTLSAVTALMTRSRRAARWR